MEYFSSLIETSINGCQRIYVGDIEIPLEEVTTRPNVHENEDHVAAEEKVPRSNSP